jgi:ascorbate-specific PTS system EIIC-type component UlaA
MASNSFPRGQASPLLAAAISAAGMLLLLEAIQYHLPKIIAILQHGMQSASAVVAIVFAVILVLTFESRMTSGSQSIDRGTQKRESA